MERNKERTFFDERGITITSTRFMLPGDKTFAMSGVTAVKAHEVHPKRGWPIFLLAVGLLSLFGGRNSIPFALLMIIIGGIWLARQKSMFYVVLNTASGEAQALQDRDGEWIRKVVRALNECIVHRG